MKGIHYYSNYPVDQSVPSGTVNTHLQALVADGTMISLGHGPPTLVGLKQICTTHGITTAIWSPIFVTPKRANSVPVPGQWRVLLDASYPRDSALGPSVNGSIPVSMTMSLPSHTMIANDARLLCEERELDQVVASKVDWKGAFYCLPLLPAHRSLVCCYSDGEYYMYQAACMGVKSIPGYFQRVAVALNFLLHRHLRNLRIHRPSMLAYLRSFLDDIIIMTLQTCGSFVSQSILLYLVHVLGVPVNRTKFLLEGAPSTSPTVLGLRYDMTHTPFTLELTDARRSAVLTILKDWRSKQVASLKSIHSLLGILQFVRLAVPTISPYLFSLRAAAGQASRSDSRRPVPFRTGFRLDLLDLHQLIKTSRGAQLMWPPANPTSAVGFTDASTGKGCGGYIVLQDTVYYYGLQWTDAERAFIGPEDGEWSNSPLETLAVAYLLEGLARFVPAGDIADLTTVHSDNMSTVSSCNALRGRKCALTNMVIQQVLRGLLALDDPNNPLCTYTHKLAVQFVRGILNPAADALSRNRTDLFLLWLNTFDARVVTKRQNVATLTRVDMTATIQAHRRSVEELSRDAAGRRL